MTFPQLRDLEKSSEFNLVMDHHLWCPHASSPTHFHENKLYSAFLSKNWLLMNNLFPVYNNKIKIPAVFISVMVSRFREFLFCFIFVCAFANMCSSGWNAVLRFQYIFFLFLINIFSSPYLATLDRKDQFEPYQFDFSSVKNQVYRDSFYKQCIIIEKKE